ncbi:MAG: glycosyl transferase, family 9 [Bryobacterales bacterium]|jgi:heptosyltransferase-3|nr:glycosyl transferase, family 9 [Bryobacterales bacterium]
MRRLLIRPGAIGDFIVSLPAMEALRGDYTEVWCAEQNVPLARFADRAISLGASGLNRLGLLPANDVIARLRGFDSIISWSITGKEEILALDVTSTFFPALPPKGVHAVRFYNDQARFLGGAPLWTPSIPCPAIPRTCAAIHPFASSPAKRAPIEFFRQCAARLADQMPVHWLAGPEEALPDTVRISDLYELACWLAGARVYVGNDSGISHLAAAVGTPVLAIFQATKVREWSPRGSVIESHQCALPRS